MTCVDVEQRENNMDNSLGILTIGSNSASSIQVELYINGKPLTMEVETGAAVSIVSEQQLNRLQPQIQVSKSNVVLRTYTSEVIPMLGEVQLNVTYKGHSYTLVAYVTKGIGPCLLGRDWLKKIQLDWKEITYIAAQSTDNNHTQLEATIPVEC